MRIVANIAITFTTLIMLTFGVGGISMTKCACSGKTTLLTINNNNCCPTEGNCMSVTTVQLSESILPDNVEAPELMPAMLETSALHASLSPFYPSLYTLHHTLPMGYPPPRLPLTTVLRV